MAENAKINPGFIIGFAIARLCLVALSLLEFVRVRSRPHGGAPLRLDHILKSCQCCLGVEEVSE